MEDEETCTWIALEAATRNVTVLLRIRKEVPTTLGGLGGRDVVGLASEDAIHDGEELKHA